GAERRRAQGLVQGPHGPLQTPALHRLRRTPEDRHRQGAEIRAQRESEGDLRMSHHLYAAYVLACLVATLIPGPTVTLIVANGLRHGTRPALLNVSGGQIGLGLMLLTVLVGLTSLISALGDLFDWLRL